MVAAFRRRDARATLGEFRRRDARATLEGRTEDGNTYLSLP